jgi:hypothetical protein
MSEVSIPVSNIGELPKAVTEMVNKINGGGASEYGVQVFGDMNNQVKNDVNGAIQLKPTGGDVTQMAVPALLVLANNSSKKIFSRTSAKSQPKYYKSKKYQGGSIPDNKLGVQSLSPPMSQGGNLLQQAVVPATLIIASNMMGKNAMRKMSPFSQKKYTKRSQRRFRNTRSKRNGKR